MSVQSTQRGRVLLSIALAGLALVLAACSASPRVTATVANGVVEISAMGSDFSASTIGARTGEPFTVRFTNHDPVSHNFAVYTGEGGDLIVRGDLIQGPDASTEVHVPALDAGTYFFRCDVHADHMKGALVVGG